MNENDTQDALPSDDWQARTTRTDGLLLRMNHEIRTAANVILGLTDVVLESELSSILFTNVSAARASAERLLQESADILDLARAELGCLRLCSTSFKLNDTLQQAVDRMSILASSKRITLKFHLSRKTPLAVVGDPGRLIQILTTLVRASIDRLEQGDISVSVEHESDYAEGNKITFSIADNGRRIPPELISRMFDGGLEQETAMQGGSGLGVTLAGHLAGMMGGKLWADEDPPIGAVCHFSVNLPPAPMVDFLKLYKAEAEVRTDRRPLKLLVADDSVDTLFLVRAFLKDAPWGIESAANGRAALEMAVSRSYDLILMDLDMPEMDGYSATRKIRTAEYLREKPAVPIVALTAHNEAEAASKSIEAGCTAHVTKPIRKAALLDTIQRYASDGRK